MRSKAAIRFRMVIFHVDMVCIQFEAIEGGLAIQQFLYAAF